MGFNLAEYFRHKNKLKEKIAAKSREQMEQRHAFFNGDNEICDDQSEEEEEEQEELVGGPIEEDNDSEASEGYNSAAAVEALSDGEDARWDQPCLQERGGPKECEEVEGEQTKDLDDEDGSSLSFSSASLSSVVDRLLEPELGFSSSALSIGPDEGGFSQDFDAALNLCSGSFGPVSLLPVTQSANFFENNDIFTVEDDASLCPITPEDFDSPDEDGQEENGDKREAIKSKFHVRDMFYDEAELSGDEGAGSDEEDDNPDHDGYEEEENDEQLPSEEVIREDLARQYIRQKNDEEERRLRELMNQYLPDGEFYSEQNVDRSFRIRMRDEKDIDWSKVLGCTDATIADDEEEPDEEEMQATQVRERKIQMMKWKAEQERQNKSIANVVSECSLVTSLVGMGQQIAKKQKLKSDKVLRVEEDGEEDCQIIRCFKLPQRDSLRGKSQALGPLVRDSVSGISSSKARGRALFISSTSAATRNAKEFNKLGHKPK